MAFKKAPLAPEPRFGALRGPRRLNPTLFYGGWVVFMLLHLALLVVEPFVHALSALETHDATTAVFYWLAAHRLFLAWGLAGVDAIVLLGGAWAFRRGSLNREMLWMLIIGIGYGCLIIYRVLTYQPPGVG